jgi:predicted ATPase
MNTARISPTTTVAAAALDLLKTLPETAQRIQQELGLEIALGTALTPIKGAAAPEVEAAYTRARQLSHRGAETADLFPALWGLFLVCLMRGNRKAADELSEQLFTLAQRLDDPILVAIAHYVLANKLSFIGEFAPACHHFEQSLTLYETHGRPSVVFLMGEELGVVCRGFMAWETLWPLGYAERALRTSEEGLHLARELRSPYDLALALLSAASLHQLRREPELTRERAEAAIAIATEQGFSGFGTASVLLGWALVAQNQSEDGIPQILQGIEANSGAGYTVDYQLPLLVEAYCKTGQTEAGLRALNEAENLLNKTGIRCYEAELYRLRGELSLSQNETNDAEAEVFFRRAIGVARQQSAKSWELRATVSLARLLAKQAKRAEAQAMLTEIYGWFTEGFDTADLKDAKALLDRLTA